MPDAIERALSAALANGSCCIGEIAVRSSASYYILTHRDDLARNDLRVLRSAGEAINLAKFDEAGRYRPLKTAPNLVRGWRLEVTGLGELRRALDYFYPGRLAVFAAWKDNQLETTPLRQTLDRQTGMYRIAAKISDDQINDLVASFCRSDGGCLRTILWKRDAAGSVATTRLPPGKFEPNSDQAGAVGGGQTIPLLCQEACNLLIAECRKIVKPEDEL
jgi:sirohydrochlorin cobaltochelatase